MQKPNLKDRQSVWAHLVTQRYLQGRKNATSTANDLTKSTNAAAVAHFYLSKEADLEWDNASELIHLILKQYNQALAQYCKIKSHESNLDMKRAEAFLALSKPKDALPSISRCIKEKEAEADYPKHPKEYRHALLTRSKI